MMKEMAKYALRAKSVLASTGASSPPKSSPRLDSWRVEEVTPKVAARIVPDEPLVVPAKPGRPVNVTKAVRDIRWVSYFTDTEDDRITQYMKKRRVSRSDAVRELVLIGLKALVQG